MAHSAPTHIERISVISLSNVQTLDGRESPAAAESISRKVIALGLKDGLPGMVSSIKTFGSSGNWHPHIHALVTDGLIERGGKFHLLGTLDPKATEQRFRKLVLARLRRAKRLSESFHERLLSWEHSGFSVHAGELIEPTEQESLERMARYMTRAPIALAKVFEQRDGRVKLLTPPKPKTGQDHLLLDPLEWVHAARC